MNQMTNKVLSKAPLRQVSDVRSMLMNEQAFRQLEMVAAHHMRPDRMMRLMANSIRTTPKLAQCDPMSLLGAMMTCASLGLEPNTVLGHAYLVPFENKRKGIVEVTLIIGYKGMIDLARRSGEISNITAQVVYDDDELWDYEYGSEMRLRHKPGPRQGKKIAAYCHAKLKDGGEAFTVLPWSKIEETRNASQGYRIAKQYNKTDTPWIAHEDAMAAKTAVRDLFKHLPISIERVNDAAQIDEASGADFAKFAVGMAQNGDMPELADDMGDVIDGETGEVVDEEPEPEKKPKPRPAAKAAQKPVEEPKREEKPAYLDDDLDQGGEEDGDDGDETPELAEARAALHAVAAEISNAPIMKEKIIDYHWTGAKNLKGISVAFPDEWKAFEKKIANL